jgi:predicted O-methyltransferase YrrM
MTLTILKVAMEILKEAGVDNKVTIVVGRAAGSITKISSEEPFDLVFIDADKASIYFSEAKRLVRKGGIIMGLSRVMTKWGVPQHLDEHFSLN